MRSTAVGLIDATGKVLRVISGEFFLELHPNGGTVIAIRTFWVSSFLFAAYIGLSHRLDGAHGWVFSWQEFARSALPELKVYGAILAGTYASLYARFASQWAYLAGLYNQIVAAGVSRKEPFDDGAYVNWIAGFIEDAQDLHLATKPCFRPAIVSWLEDPEVEKAFVDGAESGKKRLAILKERLAESEKLQGEKVKPQELVSDPVPAP